MKTCFSLRPLLKFTSLDGAICLASGVQDLFIYCWMARQVNRKLIGLVRRAATDQKAAKNFAASIDWCVGAQVRLFYGKTERGWEQHFGVTSLMLELLPDGRIIWNIFTVHQHLTDLKFSSKCLSKIQATIFGATNSLLIHCAFGQISLDFWRIVATKYVLFSKNISIKLRQIVGHLCSREEQPNLWILFKKCKLKMKLNTYFSFSFSKYLCHLGYLK